MKVFCGTFVLLVAATLFCAVPAETQSIEGDYVIVANKELQGTTISTAILKGIYLREILSWANSAGEIIPVDLSTQAGFYQTLFGKSYGQMQAYWLNMRIKHSAALPVSKKDAEGVKQFIAQKKGAIGFIKNGDLDDRVKVLKVVN
jgi:ABC-type phosphate transport system substrate-binding protein